MKVIFRSNDRFAKKTLGHLGGAEEWLESLKKYLSDSAVARLSLFEESNDISLATLDIIDGSLHVHASEKHENKFTAIESVINKCAVQLRKENNINNFNDTIRYNDNFNISFDSLCDSVEVNPIIEDAYDLLETEKVLSAEKKTPRYNRIMNKYINYLYRTKEIESITNHINVLYTIYNEIDKETITVADYERLVQSINQLNEELYLLMEKQETFENNAKDNAYLNYIIDKEATLAKLKK